MDFQNFIDSLNNSEPPKNISVYLQALWQDARQNWDGAHELIQDIEDKKASWIHAYLHREEGDTGNAAYWYHLAGKKMPDISLKEEWESLVQVFLKQD